MATLQHSHVYQLRMFVYEFLTTLHHFDNQSTVREIALSWTVLPFPRACFLTTLTFRTPQENHIVSVPFDTIEKNKKICFSIF